MNPRRVSDAARSDLAGIWLYIAGDNPEAADKFIRALVSRFPMLASMPEIGRKREELSPRLRSFPVGRYIIFYRPMENGVEISRVLHGAMDFPPLFE
jgi:toxin ParE1/3/4